YARTHHQAHARTHPQAHAPTPKHTHAYASLSQDTQILLPSPTPSQCLCINMEGGYTGSVCVCVCVCVCQVLRCFLTTLWPNLKTAWCINPKGRTGQLVPTQNDFYFFYWLAHLGKKI